MFEQRRGAKNSSNLFELLAFVLAISCVFCVYRVWTTSPSVSGVAPSGTHQDTLTVLGLVSDIKQQTLTLVKADQRAALEKIQSIETRLSGIEKALSSINSGSGSSGNNNNNKASKTTTTTFSTFQCVGLPVALGDDVFAIRQAAGSTEPISENVVKLLDQPKVNIVTQGGSDMISKILLTQGVWERTLGLVVSSLSRHYRRSQVKMIFLDVGSNLGSFGMIPAADGHDVVLFEPVPQTVARLCQTVSLNKVGQNTLIVPHAVGASESSARIQIPPTNYGAARLLRSGETNSESSHPVKMVTLDSVVSKLGFLSRSRESNAIVVKIDVDGGFEYDIWLGGKQTLSSPLVDAIILQNAWSFSPDVSQRIQWLHEIEQLGFQLYCCTRCQDLIETGRCVAVNLDDRVGLIEKGLGIEIVAVRSAEILNVVAFAR